MEVRQSNTDFMYPDLKKSESIIYRHSGNFYKSFNEISNLHCSNEDS